MVSCSLLWYVRSDGDFSVLHRMGLLLCHRIITIADGVRAMFPRDMFKKYSKKFVTVNTGFDFDNSGRYLVSYGFLDEKSVSEEYVIGMVGSIVPRKGQDLLVRAVAMLLPEFPSVRVLIVGGAPESALGYKEELATLIRKLRVEGKVRFLGYVSDSREMFRRLDLFVLPSYAEGLPRTVIEALAAGVPVVATDVGGVQEILVDERLGTVVPPGDVQVLAAAIRRWMETPNGPEARVFRSDNIKQRFSMQSFVHNFEMVLLDLNSID
jgi:glycosyltransferase involved in cell wall biosynthesis